MHQATSVAEFKAAEALLYTDVQGHIFASRGVEGWGNLSDKAEEEMVQEMREAAQDKRELLATLREQEAAAALAECKQAVAFAEEIANGADGEAKFEIHLNFLRVEDVKPEYADEAAELAEQGKPSLAKLDEELGRLSGRIEAAKGKAVDDPAILDKLEELKQEREVAIIEGRETAGIDKQIIDLQEEVEANHKAAALAAEEVEILTRHAEKVKARRDAVADIVAHIEGVADAFRAFLAAAEYHKAALDLGEFVKEFTRLSKNAANAPGNIRVPDTNGCRLSFALPRLEGSLAYIDDRGAYTRRIFYGPERDILVRV